MCSCIGFEWCVPRRHLFLTKQLTILSDELKGQLLEMGICEVLIPLTNSPSTEVQGNSAAALGNLSSKGSPAFYHSASHDINLDDNLPSDGRTATDDYSAFNDVWDKPDGGMHRYLYHFLTSPDATFQHIAVWTIVQLLESGGGLLYFSVLRNPLTNLLPRPPTNQ